MDRDELRKIKLDALESSSSYDEIKSFYDSPISTYISQFHTRTAEEYDHQILKAVWKLGIQIDEDGLVKALNQDRLRYEEAYNAGYAACKKEYEDRMRRIAELTGVKLENVVKE